MFRRPNLGISRPLAIVTVIGVSVVALAVIVVSFLVIGVAADASPSLVTVVGLFATVITGLFAALKATETADTASKTHDVVTLTASQNAAIQQVLMAHCGAICPLPNCALRELQARPLEVHPT